MPPALISSGRISIRAFSALSQRMPKKRDTPSIPSLAMGATRVVRCQWMRTLAALVTGRRGKWITVLVWVALAAVIAPLGSKLADKTDNRTESFLPKSAESTKVVRLLDKEFPGGQTVTGLIVYHRPGGLTGADKAKMVADARKAAAKLPLVGKPVVPFQPGSPKEL